MDLGPVELSPTFNNAFTLRDRVGELTAGARAIVAAWTESGTLVVVRHGANILPLTGRGVLRTKREARWRPFEDRFIE